MKILNTLVILLFSSFIYAQDGLIPLEELENEQLFKSMEEALLEPENVVRLDLSKQKIPNLDYDFRKLVKIQWLKLAKNDFKKFPIAVTELPLLQWLDLSKNDIDKIPDEIGKLQYLRSLNMSKNKIYVISPELGKLKKLETIDLWDNPIKTFPIELRGMSSLKLLDLRVTVINDTEKKKLQKMFPYTKIKFSKTCNCK